MRLHLSVTLIAFACLLVGLEAKDKKNHQKWHKKGYNEGKHGRITWDKKSGASSNNHKVHFKKINWLNVPEVTGCKCRRPGEICLEGPDKRPACVLKHHLQESTRLFKHYHEQKEKAEEMLNEVDPHPSHTQLDAPHDLHIDVKAIHESHKKHDEHKQHPKGQTPKAGKHHHDHLLVRTHDAGKATGVNSASSTTCDGSTMVDMSRRLTGWFHLLHAKDHSRRRGNKHHRKGRKHLSVKKELRDGNNEEGRCDCLKSVMWEFHQIDTDHNHMLSKAEVKVIDNNDMEPCLHPYLMTCDKDGDGHLSRHEWCCCFPQTESESPCYAKLKEIEDSKKPVNYVPSCDREGFYQKEQCMGDALTNQTCWCVTPNGSEIPGSRVSHRAHCGKLDNMGYPKGLQA